MEKTILKYIFLALITALVPIKAVMADYPAGNSADIKKTSILMVRSKAPKAVNYYLKKAAMKSVLESYKSSLTEAVDSFITACQKYEIDCYLMPSITGVESFFGKYLVHNSYNPFGWGGGYIIFKSWDEAIDKVAAGLRNNYIDKGADTVEKIGPIYAGGSYTWAPKVIYFMNEFEKEEAKYLLFFNTNKVQL